MKQHPTRKDVWVSEDGRVFKELFPSKDSGGYHQIRAGVVRERRHVLVCETYHGARPKGMVVRHLDGDPSNDRPSNLAWGTIADNYQDTVLHGRSTKHERNPSAKLNEEQVREIKRRRADGESGVSLAREFGVSQQTICGIKNGRDWPDVR